MKTMMVFLMAGTLLLFTGFGCSSTDEREPASWNRAGREYKEPRAMNHRRLDTETLYQSCLKERPEVSCRNRMGR